MGSNHTLKTLLEILFVSARLGLTSFGGPVAHLGYFYEEYVKRRKWLDEKSYADLVALCQFLPGPASSQVGIGIGVMRAGMFGGILSFIGFTLPSVLALVLFASLFTHFGVAASGWIHGLNIVAVAVVAYAIIGMGKNLTPTLATKAIALISLVCALLWQTTFTQVGIIIMFALIGAVLFKDETVEVQDMNLLPLSRNLGMICLLIFFGLLFLLPLIKEMIGVPWLDLFDRFYRSGALVYGGGHVVLPLLERELVPAGYLSAEAFLAGYGAAQAVPGPLFTFAAYLGAVIGGVGGGLLATLAIFLPGFLLIIGTLPFWNALRRNKKVKGALTSVNAAVVGVLIAAFYNPIWTSTMIKPIDFALAAVLFSLLTFWKIPAWLLVIVGMLGGGLVSFIS